MPRCSSLRVRANGRTWAAWAVSDPKTGSFPSWVAGWLGGVTLGPSQSKRPRGAPVGGSVRYAAFLVGLLALVPDLEPPVADPVRTVLVGVDEHRRLALRHRDDTDDPARVRAVPRDLRAEAVVQP